MQQALELARRGLGQTYPNPAVGCVIVTDGKVCWHAATASCSCCFQLRSRFLPATPAAQLWQQSVSSSAAAVGSRPHILMLGAWHPQVVGEGFHPKAGMPHAEVYALRAAGGTLHAHSLCLMAFTQQ
jgi:pyrimidine deaminase RibD-like protein